MRYLSQLKKSDLAGKTCLLRVNLDVEPDLGNWRLNGVIPTIKFLLENNCKIIIFGHRGRPEGKRDDKLSVEPVVNILSQKIGQKLEWLENVRFDAREQAVDKSLAKEIAIKGDLFVNDDFATAHRSSATVSHLPKLVPAYAGLLMEKELRALSRVIKTPEQPLVVIIGGLKIGDKVGVINYLYDKANYFLMGSTYLSIKNNKNKVISPEDYVYDENSNKLDIGPKTIEKYKKIIDKAKTIIWNGPLGRFEDEQYREGSEKIARAIATSSAFSIVGGGDTDKLVRVLGLVPDDFGLISTGGGAMLSFLAGKELPAIEALSA